MIIHRPQLAPRRRAGGVHQVVRVDEAVAVPTGVLFAVADHSLHQTFVPRVSAIVAVATPGAAVVQKQEGDFEGRVGGVGGIVVVSCVQHATTSHPPHP